MKALKLTNLEKVYNNGFEALKGIDLIVEEGDFFALLGPNGAGKSTLIGIVSSLVNKTEGDVEIFGIKIDQDVETAKSLIGLVPQEINFSQFETPEQIVVNQGGFYGIERSIALDRAEKYLKQLGLWEKRHDAARTLSGGMKRRLMIARALVHQPQLLILDEPTAGVDIELRRSMWDFLQELNDQGITIILTTHYLEEAESLCRNIAIIDHGSIIKDTSMKSLLSQLNVETIILDVVAGLKVVPEIEGYQIELSDENTMEVKIEKHQSINKLFYHLTDLGIEISSMRNKSNRLEELFLRLLEKS
ncbi:MAG: ABC transporter ATP-binding protein [Gammaproteobacteria bacterium]